jgi:serine-type D-Ala-D-Ala carboxypeptidase (penicillin-binding protein 5/6)
MKTLILFLILGLQVTGAWPHLPDGTRQRLSIAATNPDAVPKPTAPATLPLSRPPAIPIQSGTQALNLPVTSVLATDVTTGATLHAQNPTIRRPIASLTKMATALVILSRHSLDETITIPMLPEYRPEDERLGLVAGETYRLEDLLRALMIKSANDAADALAIADAGSVPAFVDRMNGKMNEWGIRDVHFAGPSGLTDKDNYATAEALAKIGRLILTNPFLKQTVSQTSATMISGGGRIVPMQTTNKLLYAGDFYGIKTGYTLAAGECFVGLTRINGHEVITVVLDADDRFGNTQTLANWISRNWTWL